MGRLRKTVLALLVAVAVALCVPVMARAEGEDDDSTTDTTTYVAQIDGAPYDTLDKAIAAAEDGATIELLKDCELTKGFDKTLTFTGNGKITCKSDLPLGANWMVYGNHTLTFRGSGVTFEWDSTTWTCPNPKKDRWLMMSLSGTINVTEGATFRMVVDSKDGADKYVTTETAADGTTKEVTHYVYPNCAIYMNAGSQINVSDGAIFEIKGANTEGVTGQAIQLDSPGTANINVTGGSTFLIDGTNRGYVNSPSIQVEDSTFTVQNCTANGSNGGQFTATGSTISYLNNAGHGLSADSITLVDSTLTADGNGYYGVRAGSGFTVDAKSKITVTQNSGNGDYAGLKLGGDITDGRVESGAVIAITNNYCSGLSNNGKVTFEEGVKLTITGNLNDKGTTSNGGGVYNSGASANLTLPSDAVIYNNHAKTAGDDIYNNTTSTITFGRVGSGWALDNKGIGGAQDDCSDPITGWYYDLADARWEAHDRPYHVESLDFEGATTQITGLTGLKAAHDLAPLDPDDPNLPVWTTSKSKTATNLDANYESQVTLSLPAANMKPEIDVALVIDVSSSMKDNDIAEAKAAAIAMCDELAAKENLDVKIGVVTFDKTSHTLTDGLVDIEAAKSAINRIDASEDTNMMAGLIAGKRLLESGTADEDNKYFVLMSDGIPTYWVDDSGDAVGKELVQLNKNQEETGRMPAGTEPEGSISGPDATDYISKMMSVDELMAKTDVEDDSNEWRQITDTGAIANPEEYRYTNIEKSTYMTGKYLEDEILSSYKLKMIAFGVDKYENNVVYTWGENFCDWIGRQVGSENYFKIAKPGYGGETGELTEAFKEMANDLVYLVDKGSKVKDVIGYGDTYNMDFIADLSKIELTVDGQPLDETVIDEGHLEDNETARYGFGVDATIDAGYKFILHYFENGEDGHSDECFVWDINAPVMVNHPVQLTYSVRLTNPQTADGTYGTYDADGAQNYDGLYTNNSAVLYPVDSNGEDGVPESFRKPTVSYTIGSVTITPADITIYMGGSDGYESVIESGEETKESNSLPEPGFYITLPDEVNDALSAELGDGASVGVADLSTYVKIYVKNNPSHAWTLQRYGAESGSVAFESEDRARFVYRIVPESTGQDPVRLEFTSESGEHFVSDAFDPASVESLSNSYTMGIYPGEVDANNVAMEITVGSGEDAVTYTRDVKLETGTLNVRYVVGDQNEVVTGVVATDEQLAQQTGANPSKAFAQVQEGTRYAINGGTVILDTDGTDASPSLLFDDVVKTISSTGEDYEDLLEKKAAAALTEEGVFVSNMQYQAKYLDLVDANNGNVWLQAVDTKGDATSVDVYWPYPEGTDESTQFYLVHVEDLHREMGVSELANMVSSAPTDVVEVYNTKNGIKFSTTGFSPFVLVWGASGSTPDPEPSPTTGSLKITKQVTGDLASKDDEFTFRITLSGTSAAQGTKKYGGVTFTNGVAEVKLSDGESVTISGLPSGTEYTVEEVDGLDYALASSSGTSGTIAANSTKTASFVNDRSTPDEPDTPDTPDTPDEPDTPDTPDTPDEPSTPDTPDEPSTPGTPSTPATPSKPSQAAGTSKSEVPDTGDHTNVVLPAALALGGVALVGGALMVVRKRAK